MKFTCRAAMAALAVFASASAMAQVYPTAGTYGVRTPVDVPVSISYATVIVPGDGQNTVSLVQAPAGGNVVFPTVITGTSQAFLYTPNAAFVGLDQFIYKVRDGTGDLSFGSIAINVGNVTAAAGDDYPVIGSSPDSFLDIFFNDLGFADPVAVVIVQQPAHGTLTIEVPGPSWQSLIGVYYTPAPGYAGADQFQYQIGDGIDQDTATVNLTVSADGDGDTVLDYYDNCPAVSNPNQEDNEGDGLGDACDPDDDNDTVADTADNCLLVANASQLNADGDRFGNICDADLNNSGLTTASDFNLLRSVINRPSTFSALAAAADMNGSGLVTAIDFNLLRSRLNKAPGPSGLPP